MRPYISNGEIPGVFGLFSYVGERLGVFLFPWQYSYLPLLWWQGERQRHERHDSKKGRFTQTSPHLGIVAASWQRPYTTPVPHVISRVAGWEHMTPARSGT